MPAKKLGELLVEGGLVSRGQLDDALQAQMIYGGRLGTNLVELGYLSESHLAEFLSTQLGLPAVSAAEIDAVSSEALGAVTPEVASKYLIFPLAVAGRRLRLAMADPTDLAAFDEIRFQTGFAIQPVVAPELLLLYALEKHYRIPRPTRYLRLDRNTEAEMMDAHRAGLAPVALGSPGRELPAPARSAEPGVGIAREAGVAVDAVGSQLIETTEHAQVAEILCDALWTDFEHVAIFGVTGVTAVGWIRAGIGSTDEDFRRLSFTLEDGLELSRIVRGRVPRLAQIGESATELWLLETLGASPARRLLFFPVAVGEEPLLFAVCDGRRPGVPENLGKYVRLSRKVAATVQMLNYRQEILEA